MSSGLPLPGNRTWRCEVEDVRHYNKYFMTLLTSERGDVETSRARTFFLSSGVSIAYILLLQDTSLSPLPKDSKTQQTQISQVDLDRVLKLIEIRNDRIDLMQFCAAMHLIIAKMRLPTCTGSRRIRGLLAPLDAFVTGTYIKSMRNVY